MSMSVLIYECHTRAQQPMKRRKKIQTEKFINPSFNVRNVISGELTQFKCFFFYERKIKSDAK